MDEQTIRKELERVLSCPRFTQSKRLSDFLSYIVETHLKHDANSVGDVTISEVAIAQDVFGKDARFDPSMDSVVRVTANRLRTALNSYYADKNASGDIRITVPAGSYVPKFIPTSAESEDIQKLRFWRRSRKANLVGLSLLGFVAIAAISVGIFRTSTGSTFAQNLPELPRQLDKSPYPVVAIAPFENLTGDQNFDILKSGLQVQFAGDMDIFKLLKTARIDEIADPVSSAGGSRYDYVLSGNINGVNPDLDISVSLKDMNSGEIVWDEHITRKTNTDEYYQTISEVSTHLASNFGGRESILLTRAIDDIQYELEHNTLAAEQLTAFQCYALYKQYHIHKTTDTFDKVNECLDINLKRNPSDATMISTQAMIYWEMAIVGGNPALKNRHSALRHIEIDPSIDLGLATDWAGRAVALDPENIFSLITLAQTQELTGDLQNATLHARNALQINPSDSDHRAYYAKLQAMLGNFDEAEVLAKQALSETKRPTGYQYKTILQAATAKRNFEDLRIHLESYKEVNKQGRYFTVLYETALAIVDEDQVRLQKNKAEVQKYYDILNGDLFSGLRADSTPQQTIDVLDELFTTADIKTRPEGL